MGGLMGKATNPKKEEEICFRVPLYWLRSLQELVAADWLRSLYEFAEWGCGFGAGPWLRSEANSTP